MSLASLTAERRDKINKLKEMGQDAYPSNTTRRLDLAQVRSEAKTISTQEMEIVVAGRLISSRVMGKIQFLQIRDGAAQLQIMFKQDLLGDNFKAAKLLDVGDFIEAKGKLITTKTGELTCEATEWHILSKSLRPLPEKFYGLKDQEERYRRRYLDLLVNPAIKNIFIKRSQFIQGLRDFLNNEKFLEVETPILQPLAGGAMAEPFVTHHNALDIDLYLRIATELYLKRLIVGGLDRVYEIGPDFRNEGLSTQHLQEFTQCEFYMAYANYETLIEFTESLLSTVIKKTFGQLVFSYQGKEIDFTPPWPRLDYGKLMAEKTGIDIFALDSDVKKLRTAIKKAAIQDIEDKRNYSFAKLLDNLYKKMVRPEIIQPSFLLHQHIDLLPLAKRRADNPWQAESFQLLAAGGYELVKAYSELNDPIDQKKRFKQQSLLKGTDPEAHAYDKDFVEALEYGMPPTAGWGMGIDRMLMLLTDQPSIRDVVLFPMLKPN